AAAFHRSREPLPTASAGPVQGTWHQASTDRCCHSHQLGSALKAVRLALCSSRRATGDLDPLASSALASALAMEVAARTPTDSTGTASAYPAYGNGKPVLG